MFNFELYKEGLRKTKTLGILFIVGMLLGAVAQPLIEISNHVDSMRMGWLSRDSIIPVYSLRASFMMILAPLAGAPIITLSIFSFLNKRSDSDFYHAIPHKRETLFGSFIASILTWVVGGMWLSTTVSVIIYGVSSHAHVDISSVIWAVLGMSAASLLVIASTALAMSITGNGLSNIVASGLILFLPRTLMFILVNIIVQATLVVSSANFGILGNHHYNIIFGMLSGFNMWGFDDTFTIGTIYTLVLGVLYLIIARILFKKRHSELAGNPGTNLIQHIIRIAVTFVITLPAIINIINNNDDYRFNNSDMVIVVYIVAAFSYFAYEFFTTKRIPRLTKMIPGLVVVAVLNIIFIVGINISRNAILQEINVADIQDVIIIDLESSQWWQPTYADLNMRGLEIADEEIVDFFGGTLNSNIARFSRRGGPEGFQTWNHTEVRVRFNIDGGRNLTRSVWVANPRLSRQLREYEPYQEIFMQMPENPDYIFIGAGHRELLTQEQFHNIYEVLREEVALLEFEDWYDKVAHLGIGSRGSEYEIEVSGRNFTSIFPIIEELTSRTFELLESYLGIED